MSGPRNIFSGLASHQKQMKSNIEMGRQAVSWGFLECSTGLGHRAGVGSLDARILLKSAATLEPKISAQTDADGGGYISIYWSCRSGYPLSNIATAPALALAFGFRDLCKCLGDLDGPAPTPIPHASNPHLPWITPSSTPTSAGESFSLTAKVSVARPYVRLFRRRLPLSVALRSYVHQSLLPRPSAACWWLESSAPSWESLADRSTP
jgi:hypothetical protein